MTRITLSVPADYVVPEIYTADKQTVALALTLGAAAYKALEGEAVAAARNETESEAVKRITEELRATWEPQLATLRREKKRAEEALEVARARIEALDSAAGEVRAAAAKETKAAVADLLAAKDDQIRRLQGLLEGQVGGLATRVENLQSSLTKSFSSSKEKGSIGETIVEQFLKKAFPESDVSVVSKEAQTADIRMMRGEAEYFWEVKNYTRMVSTEEVEKFRRDMRLHPAVRAGVLVSLRTGIVCRSKGADIDIEFLEDGRAIVFLSNLMAREDAVFYLQTLRPLFQTLEAMARPVATEAEAVRALESKAALIANLLRSHVAAVARHRNSLVTHKKRMDTMFAEFTAYVMETETQLQTLLRLAVGAADTETVAAEAETFLPGMVFTKERLTDLDGRKKEFVAWLLEATEAREGTQVEIKELIVRAKEKGFSENFVRDVREELFQGAAWARGARYILGLRWHE